MIINLKRAGMLPKNVKFHSAVFKESCGYLKNPGCGWYRIYTFYAEKPVQEVYLECEDEELVLVLINIGYFKDSELSDSALYNIGEILSFFRRKKKGIILRIAYDTEGRGMEREPETGELIRRHMRQLGRAILPFTEDIFVIQGILAGSWGEMHGSRFLSERWMTELTETMLEAVEYKCALAVRTPCQWRTIVSKSSGKIRDKLALFNDGIFGTETDMGTYGTERREQAGNHGSWCREDELGWQQEHMCGRFNGGEILGRKDCLKAAEDMKKMHISYLNSVYQKESLDAFRAVKVNWETCKSSVSGYDYIGTHLGYRFVVKAAALKGRRLKITVENCGFAELCEDAECRLILETEKNEKMYFYPDTDPRKWKSGTSTVFDAGIDPAERKNGDRCYLQLRRKRDGRILFFANEGEKENVLIGCFGNIC